MTDKIKKAIAVLEVNKLISSTQTEFCKSVDLAIQALEKQIAKKPIPIYGISNSIHSYSCPTCENAYLGGGEYRYGCCEDCGQKLNWEEV